MSSAAIKARPAPDQLLVQIAEYVHGGPMPSELAYKTASLTLFDAIGCGLEALSYPACTRLLGPIVPQGPHAPHGPNAPGAALTNGARVPGTSFELDPVQAAFNIGCLIRWLDYNDVWVAAEWGHPSDNLAGILAVADYVSRTRVAAAKPPLTMRDVLTALIKAYEIQGVLALENSFNRVGLDHVLLVKLATTAVVTQMLGGHRDEILNAVSQSWTDGGALRVYRHAPNAGSRKSWAAGDAASRAVWLALMTMRGEEGHPTVLSVPNWGFYDALFRGKAFKLARPFGCYVMENIVFKVSYPAEYHSQTAAECAIRLHYLVKNRLHEIERVTIRTHESAIRIISKTGPLANPADRDHCIQYIVAIGLIFGNLTAQDYEDRVAADPRIDALRDKMVVVEDQQYSADYLDPTKRSAANAIQVHFQDGSSTDVVEVQFPLGHPRRRAEGIPLLRDKFKTNLARRFPAERQEAILAIARDQKRLEATPVDKFMELFVI